MPDEPELIAQVNAWAKINLDLRILAREDDGFHQLETIFQRISLSDVIDLRVHRGVGITLTSNRPIGVGVEQNLAWRAATAYRTAVGWPSPEHAITISLHKMIPMGAGLGGGSADAGAVLRALNALNPAPLADHALFTLAATLGADVPFLTTSVPCALAWGRGERLLALPPLPVRHVHLATFRDGVNTAHAYRDLAAARITGRIAPVGSALLDVQTLSSWATLQRNSRNDFEIPVFALRPDIAAVHAAWAAAAPQALVRMSGSGATVFAVADTHPDAFHAAAARWPTDGSIDHQHAATLDTVPAVTILSPVSAPR
jgi:4-diphosphocytidyl-2-C-methyl-D-erythritol kinase